ncbi:Por secretion system C-terminal sorting domain-containing protein [Chitinophaga sp. YR573]|uniref:T9SS type A sorting domain-containing protein n=1 Tax=Chitinophaga sp. YR573 TaxID=1881040 RepID=UPI0008AC42B0|nr:T9SS type A sorting domain-containing protein [Chitinophaga sp. YR573]SEW25622.1 Por secretion system C-terminal sorting domain-containing protein [Chitinophaga sp. YR573]
MNTMLKYISGTAFLLMAAAITHGQQKAPYRLGSTAGVLQDIRTQAKAGANNRLASAAELRVDAGTILTGKVNTRRTDGKGEELVAGEIENVPGSSFVLEIKNGVLTGNIVLRKTKKAYKYYTDNTGTAYVKEISVDSVLCIDYTPAPLETARTASTAAVVAQAVTDLQSYPGGNGVVLLDFDGQYVTSAYWNNGNPINAAASTLTDAQKQEVWELVSEDYRPFLLNITTSEAVYNTYPANRRMRCIFTPTNTAAPGSGGVAYIGSFNWGNETPCWVFNGGVKGAGDAASHEVGHTFGLGHDGRISPAEGYYLGNGLWAPIMGAGYYVPVVHWSKGEYASANNTEDDLAKIASATYGVGYRTDDYGGTIGSAATLAVTGTGAVNSTGVIERTGDVDIFKFTTGGGSISLNFATPTRQPNLDILATLYNSGGGVVTSANPSGLPASLSATLSAGTYYVAVTGTGYGSPATDGYSNYGSLGSYAITGTVPAPTATAATVYKDCNYEGYAVSLPVGSYTLAQLNALGVLNDDVSSIKIPSGLEVVLYQDYNFTGAAYIFPASDFSCLVTVGLGDGTTVNLNDWTSSIVVRAAGSARKASAVGTVEKIATADEDSKLQTALTVSPNPFVNEVVVKATSTAKDGSLYISVYSLDGKTVLPLKRIVSGDKLSLSNLGAGMYLIKIFNGTTTETKKIVKY